MFLFEFEIEVGLDRGSDAACVVAELAHDGRETAHMRHESHREVVEPGLDSLASNHQPVSVVRVGLERVGRKDDALVGHAQAHVRHVHELVDATHGPVYVEHELLVEHRLAYLVAEFAARLGEELHVAIPRGEHLLGVLAARAAHLMPALRDGGHGGTRVAYHEYELGSGQELVHVGAVKEEVGIDVAHAVGDLFLLEHDLHEEGEHGGVDDLVAHARVHQPLLLDARVAPLVAPLYERLDEHRLLGAPHVRTLAEQAAHELQARAHNAHDEHDGQLAVVGEHARLRRARHQGRPLHRIECRRLRLPVTVGIVERILVVDGLGDLALLLEKELLLASLLLAVARATVQLVNIHQEPEEQGYAKKPEE